MNGDVDHTFHLLRLEYLASMPERLEELRSDVRAFRTGNPATEASLKVRLHRLAGSGGSYGFVQLSSIVREMERWLASHPAPSEAEQLAQMVERIAKAVEEVEAGLKEDSG